MLRSRIGTNETVNGAPKLQVANEHSVMTMHVLKYRVCPSVAIRTAET